MKKIIALTPLLLAIGINVLLPLKAATPKKKASMAKKKTTNATLEMALYNKCLKKVQKIRPKNDKQKKAQQLALSKCHKPKAALAHQEPGASAPNAPTTGTAAKDVTTVNAMQKNCYKLFADEYPDPNNIGYYSKEKDECATPEAQTGCHDSKESDAPKKEPKEIEEYGALLLICEGQEPAETKKTDPASSTSEAEAQHCPDGFTDDGKGGCKECPVGATSSGGGACTPCPANTYNDISGSDSCSPCPAAATRVEINFTGLTSASQCNKCPNGHRVDPVSKQCLACPPGTENAYTEQGNDQCAECLIGRWSGAGAAACTKCPPGFSTPSKGAQSAEACTVMCQAGETSDGGPCIPCPKGQFSKPGSTCEKCPLGEYSMDGRSCIKCASLGATWGIDSPLRGRAYSGEPKCVNCGIFDSEAVDPETGLCITKTMFCEKQHKIVDQHNNCVTQKEHCAKSNLTTYPDNSGCVSFCSDTFQNEYCFPVKSPEREQWIKKFCASVNKVVSEDGQTCMLSPAEICKAALKDQYPNTNGLGYYNPEGGPDGKGQCQTPKALAGCPAGSEVHSVNDITFTRCTNE